MVYQQQEPGDGGELERDAPARVVVLPMLDLVVDEHKGRCDHVGHDGAPDVAKGFLAKRPPWRVGSSKENGLYNHQLLDRPLGPAMACQGNLHGRR